MPRFATEKILKGYHEIYQQIYDNPNIRQREISENTGITGGTISRYLEKMYNQSIFQGPTIFIKPAQNYHQCATFLQFDNPLSTYKYLKEFSIASKGSLTCGSWNLLLIREKLLDLSILN